MSSNFKQLRYSSGYEIKFPDFPGFDVHPQNIKITQEIGNHDIVDLTYPRFSSFYIKALKTGTPVVIRWSNDKYSSEWYGYIEKVKKNTTASLTQPVIVRCISTAMSLKEGGSKIWTNKTAPDIVTELAKKYKLKPIVTPHKTIFTQQSLTGHTVWQKVKELAQRIGYVTHVIGTELHFHPIDVMIDKFMTVIPVLSYFDSTLPPYSAVKDQTLEVFRATLGDYSDTQENVKRIKTIFGIDPVTAKFYSSSSSASEVGKQVRQSVRDPLFNQILSTSITGNKNMSEVVASAHAQLSRFVHTAKCAGQGDPRISPFRTIEVIGTGQDTDGYWIVKKATHFITFDGRYNVEFECMNDGRGYNKPSATRPSTAGNVPLRNLTQELATGTSSTPTYSTISAPTTLVNETEAGFKVTPRRWVGR